MTATPGCLATMAYHSKLPGVVSQFIYVISNFLAMMTTTLGFSTIMVYHPGLPRNDDFLIHLCNPWLPDNNDLPPRVVRWQWLCQVLSTNTSITFTSYQMAKVNTFLFLDSYIHKAFVQIIPNSSIIHSIFIYLFILELISVFNRKSSKSFHSSPTS